MSKYMGVIQDAINGLNEYNKIEEKLISLCRETLKIHQERSDAYKYATSEEEEAAYLDWRCARAKADIAYDVLNILGYEVDYWFMDSPMIKEKEEL